MNAEMNLKYLIDRQNLLLTLSLWQKMINGIRSNCISHFHYFSTIHVFSLLLSNSPTCSFSLLKVLPLSLISRDTGVLTPSYMSFLWRKHLCSLSLFPIAIQHSSRQFHFTLPFFLIGQFHVCRESLCSFNNPHFSRAPIHSLSRRLRHRTSL